MKLIFLVNAAGEKEPEASRGILYGLQTHYGHAQHIG